MIYHYNKPVSSYTHSHLANRYFQWSCWPDEIDALQEKIEARYEFVSEDTQVEKYFIVPGRLDQIAKLDHKDVFNIRTMVGSDGPLELWERSVKADFPLKRTMSAQIESHIPRFSGSFSSVATPETLTESLKRKSKFFQVTRDRRMYKCGDVKAEISHLVTDEGQNSLSVRLIASQSEPLLEEVSTLDLRGFKNMSLNKVLLAG